ncbi:unnamed protein product [Adineta ricciae]|uniref:ADP ribosyltransferase domain-containing protein n=1 Tax=Adineta ricciae TaxID=249248 RepID=A0A815AV71_ADIRI|nr:unnamed protein product [Adineta ricciae]CAF1260590.1 unnamed protein product [Adineta ricciae]
MGAPISHPPLPTPSPANSAENGASSNAPTAFPTPLSDLYLACKENRVEDVERLLQTATLEDINRIEPLGSTALHAASFYGHEKIVKLLLDHGALRTIKNGYHLTPFHEAKTPEIRKLFERTPQSKRFGSLSTAVEWNVIDPTAAKSVSEYKETRKNWFDDVCADDDVLYLQEIKQYTHKKFADAKKIDQVYHLIDQAIEQKDLRLAVKIYTLQTGFYTALNMALASNNSVQFAENNAESQDEYFSYWHGPGGYAALIAHHSIFKEYSFVGKAYRGMIMLGADISEYKVGSLLVNKAFLSTSTDRDRAKDFTKSSARINGDCKTVGIYPTVCKYRIKNPGTAFDISEISEFPDEKEVLIMPRTAFRVVSIKEKRSFNAPLEIQIELHECALEKFVDIYESINPEDPYS